MYTNELLQLQIDVLNRVKEMRASTPVGEYSSYVCDNIQATTRGGLGLRFTPEARAICADIKDYINGEFSVDVWAGKEDQHAEVEAERIKMIDTLIARYEAAIVPEIKLSELLSEAKEFLAKDGDHYMQDRITSYICHSISRAVTYRLNATSNEAHKAALIQAEGTLKAEVERRLGSGTFIGAISNLLGDDFMESLTYQQVQTYRHNWLDRLISEYKENEA